MWAGLGAAVLGSRPGSGGCRGDRPAGKEVIPVSGRDKAANTAQAARGKAQTGRWEAAGNPNAQAAAAKEEGQPGTGR
jgi:hypothetical protein